MAGEEKKWILDMGCHRGTLMSRDWEATKHDSLEECKQAVAKAEDYWRSIGSFVWYARAHGPNGEEEELHPGTPYY